MAYTRISKIGIIETLKDWLQRARFSSRTGAEILDDRIRKISPLQAGYICMVRVMREAHRMGLGSTATMVYGHIESIEQRINHLITLRSLQDEKPEGAPGFRAFICWPMQLKGTKLDDIYSISALTPVEHLKMVAIARIVLNNIPHIQVSWLTIGRALAKIALHCGADDMGSVMIEENVVSSAGANYRSDEEELQEAIREAGFEPWLGIRIIPRIFGQIRLKRRFHRYLSHLSFSGCPACPFTQTNLRFIRPRPQ